MVKQTRTFNCAECEKEVTLEEDSKFPRKYCLNCSAKAKALFQGTNGDAKLDLSTKATPENAYGYEKPKDNGFHLTPEQCRSNALASAIEWTKDVSGIQNERLIEIAKTFEKYIVTGE